MRFCQHATDNALERYVAEIDFESSRCFGALDSSGTLIALTEAIPFQSNGIRCLEAAFSTDAGWRCRGLARAGLEAAQAWARSEGIERIILHCDARNAAMRGLLRSIDAEVSVDRFEVDATLFPRAASGAPSARQA